VGSTFQVLQDGTFCKCQSDCILTRNYHRLTIIGRHQVHRTVPSLPGSRPSRMFKVCIALSLLGDSRTPLQELEATSSTGEPGVQTRPPLLPHFYHQSRSSKAIHRMRFRKAISFVISLLPPITRTRSTCMEVFPPDLPRASILFCRICDIKHPASQHEARRGERRREDSHH
jgi:hypothetical protein